MEILYYKLAAFIPNTKDVWDFCLGGLKALFVSIREYLKLILCAFNQTQRQVKRFNEFALFLALFALIFFMVIA